MTAYFPDHKAHWNDHNSTRHHAGYAINWRFIVPLAANFGFWIALLAAFRTF